MKIGISSARFWGLIMNKVYMQEGILIPSDVDVVEFAPMIIP